jgi:hypothetical protein
MSTGVSSKGIQTFKWPENDFVFLDIPLWHHLKGHLFNAELSVGIKHGIGKTGGVGHKDNWVQYSKDNDWAILRKWIGQDSEFYEQYFL